VIRVTLCNISLSDTRSAWLFLLFNFPTRQSSDRVKVRDRALLRWAELIHDADLKDDKFRRVEGFGIEQIFKG
jgi:hypothetical protein